MTALPIRLVEREPPLAPAGVVALDAAGSLAAAALARIEAGAELYAAAGDGWLLILGPADDLPWADGCVYVGREGPVLVPTTQALSVPADLVATAVGGELVVVLAGVALRGALPRAPADRDRLAAWA